MFLNSRNHLRGNRNCKKGEIGSRGLMRVARETGLEPATSGVTGRRSNQLSYSRVSTTRSRAGINGGPFSSQAQRKRDANLPR